MIGLWLTIVISGLDRWNMRFFRQYFIIFMLYCLSGFAEIVFRHFIIPSVLLRFLLPLESLLLFLSQLMLTFFLLHCCGDNIRSSRLLHAVLGLFAVLLIMYASSSFIERYFYVTPDNRYYRGSLYPFFLLSAIAIPLLNLVGTIKRRRRLSGKVFLALLIAILPLTVALFVHIFIDIYPLIDICTVFAALSMYGLVLSDQIEQDRRRQQDILRQAQEIADQQREIAGQQRELANQRAKVMVLQMRPHFIFNTLMSIYSLCRLDPLKARQITMDFTNYLRRNFYAIAIDDAIPFSDELEHPRAYLAVEKARHDNKLAVDYSAAFTHFRLPPLTLQPIVENAVKHGMNPGSDPLRIFIRTRKTDSGTEIIVEDNGPGFDPNETKESGIALNNIRQRLEMMCSGSLTITPGEDGGTVVRVTIPDRTGQKQGSGD